MDVPYIVVEGTTIESDNPFKNTVMHGILAFPSGFRKEYALPQAESEECPRNFVGSILQIFLHPDIRTHEMKEGWVKVTRLDHEKNSSTTYDVATLYYLIKVLEHWVANSESRVHIVGK